jgi:hypothetical protein
VPLERKSSKKFFSLSKKDPAQRKKEAMMLKMQKLDQLLQKETIDKSKAYQAEYQV